MPSKPMTRIATLAGIGTTAARLNGATRLEAAPSSRSASPGANDQDPDQEQEQRHDQDRGGHGDVFEPHATRPTPPSPSGRLRSSGAPSRATSGSRTSRRCS